VSKVSIGEDEYEVADLLAYQQFSLWLYEVVLVFNELNHRIAKCHANIDWLRAVDPD
jgi:hypothetical protein